MPTAKFEYLSNTRVKLTGVSKTVEAQVDAVTSFHHQGYKYARAYKRWRASGGKAGWDGMTHLFYALGGSFPAGLLERVKSVVVEAGYAVEVGPRPPIRHPERLGGGIPCPDKARPGKRTTRSPRRSGGHPWSLSETTISPGIIPGITLYPDQVQACEAMLTRQQGIVWSSTGCLAGTTLVEVNRAGKSFKLPLVDLVHRFNGGRIEKGSVPYWDPAIPTQVRCCREGILRLGLLEAAYDSGVSTTLLVTTASGRSIRATQEHLFLTPTGWKMLRELHPGDLVQVDGGVRTGQSKMKPWYKLVTNLHVTGRAESDRITAITQPRRERVFDLAMHEEPYNFLANGFVVHNSGKTEEAIAVTKHLQEQGVPGRILFLSGRKKLLRDTRSRFEKALGEHVGFLGDGIKDIEPRVVVASVDTLVGHLKSLTKWRKSITVLFVDEGHHLGSRTWYKTAMAIPATFRFCLSGTPLDRADGKNLLVIASTGEVIHEMRSHTLAKSGRVADTTVEIIPCRRPEGMEDLEWDFVYSDGIVGNAWRNNRIAEEAVRRAKKGETVLILVQQIMQGQNIRAALLSEGKKVEFVFGTTEAKRVDACVEDLKEGVRKILIASPIFREGVDIPELSTVIIADAGKAVIKVLQQIGRGIRRKKGANRLTVVDFADFQSGYLAEHSLRRIETYKREHFAVKYLPEDDS